MDCSEWHCERCQEKPSGLRGRLSSSPVPWNQPLLPCLVFPGPSCSIWEKKKLASVCAVETVRQNTKQILCLFSACDHLKGIFQRPRLILAPAKWSFHSARVIFSPSKPAACWANLSWAIRLSMSGLSALQTQLGGHCLRIRVWEMYRCDSKPDENALIHEWGKLLLL